MGTNKEDRKTTPRRSSSDKRRGKDVAVRASGTPRRVLVCCCSPSGIREAAGWLIDSGERSQPCSMCAIRAPTAASRTPSHSPPGTVGTPSTVGDPSKLTLRRLGKTTGGRRDRWTTIKQAHHYVTTPDENEVVLPTRLPWPSAEGLRPRRRRLGISAFCPTNINELFDKPCWHGKRASHKSKPQWG